MILKSKNKNFTNKRTYFNNKYIYIYINKIVVSNNASFGKKQFNISFTIKMLKKKLCL